MSLKNIIEHEKVKKSISRAKSKAYDKAGGYESGDFSALSTHISILEDFIKKSPKTVDEALSIVKKY